MTPFESDLEQRGLLDIAIQACRPRGLRVDQLRRRPELRKLDASVVIDARREFINHLKRPPFGWSYSLIAELLAYEDHSSIVYIINGKRKETTNE